MADRKKAFEGFYDFITLSMVLCKLDNISRDTLIAIFDLKALAGQLRGIANNLDEGGNNELYKVTDRIL